MIYLRHHFAPAKDDITTIRLREIAWHIPSNQDVVIDLKRAIKSSWLAVDTVAICQIDKLILYK